jgi:AcrR family transcriptional regulator
LLIYNERSCYKARQPICEKKVPEKSLPKKRVETVLLKGRAAQGERTRQAILEVAVHLASAEGLEGLTIGKLATKLAMSKSGLFAHFGSKGELQLATVEAARFIFIREVVHPILEVERGLSRLWKLCDAWLDYVEREVFQGGCFFSAAAAEFDGRPGVVRDRIAEIMKEWLEVLERAVRQSQAAGELQSSASPNQLAFEINALQMGANWSFQLYGDPQAFAKAREAVLQRLRSLSTKKAPPLALTKRRKRRAVA